MDHAQFKAKQTAAVYVADGLDERTLEAFEMHMMGCTECIDDVESWRAIKVNMPTRARPARAPAVLGRNTHSRVGYAAPGWRMAASLVVGGVLGTAGGWFGHQSQTPNLDSTQTAFFNVPAATRGAGDCTALRFAPDTRFAVLRVPGVSRDRQVIAADAEKRELPASRYISRLQPDGSHLVRIDTQALDGREVFLEARAADGFGEPLGCVTGQVATAR
jgi:anti-sigma factor RsiW